MKPWMPCLSANLPVATEFHNIGDRIGWRVARLPMTPRLMKASRVGMSPSSSNGLMCSQSAASHPIRRTLRRVIGFVYLVERLSYPEEERRRGILNPDSSLPAPPSAHFRRHVRGLSFMA